MIRAASCALVDETPDDLAAIIHPAGGGGGGGGTTNNGAMALVALLDELKLAPPGPRRDTARLACGVYGLWIFEGLRVWLGDDAKWKDFEDDVLGCIQKQTKGRKSELVRCALHPLQMVSKYALEL